MSEKQRSFQPITCRPVQAQELFGVSTSTIYRWAKKGYIRIHKRAGCSFLLVREVEDFILGQEERSD